VTYSQWVEELAGLLGAVGVLDLSAYRYRHLRDQWAAALDEAGLAEAAATLRTVSQEDVRVAALAREQVMLARRRALVGGPWPPEHQAVRIRYVREGLEHRQNVEALDLVATEALAAVAAEPPGGRASWPGLWAADRGHDRHRRRSPLAHRP
jgi:hypothetical protein